MPSSADNELPPDAFVQMPPTQTNNVQSLRYLTDPLPQDVLIAGPAVLDLFAAVDQDDTNWFVVLKDVGPDGSVRTARDGERELPADLKERELTRGWLKASHRALDAKRSRPWKPWHRLTRAAQQKVTGRDHQYAIEIMATANLFRRGHRICVEIASADMPSGVGGATNVEYVPNHIVSSKTTLHKIYHDAKRRVVDEIPTMTIPLHVRERAGVCSAMPASGSTSRCSACTPAAFTAAPSIGATIAMASWPYVCAEPDFRSCY